jgi:hypothetical protein
MRSFLLGCWMPSTENEKRDVTECSTGYGLTRTASTGGLIPPPPPDACCKHLSLAAAGDSLRACCHWAKLAAAKSTWPMTDGRALIRGLHGPHCRCLRHGFQVAFFFLLSANNEHRCRRCIWLLIISMHISFCHCLNLGICSYQITPLIWDEEVDF